MLKNRFLRRGSLPLLATIVSAISPQAAVFWNETGSPGGSDLSTIRTAPSTFTFQTADTHSLIGSVGPGDLQDFLTITIANGFQLNSLVLASYVSTDQQGFIGVQSGSNVDPNFGVSASGYMGYVHFGNVIENMVGVDILPKMGNTSVYAVGAAGFTPPLPAGTYAFVIQQASGTLTSYQFNYGVTAVPEPHSQAAIALLCVGGYLLKRGMARRKATTA